MKHLQFFMLFLSICAGSSLSAQVERVYQTFKDSRVINLHSVETLAQGRLDIRITHRFGDIGGDNGGWSNFYGLEQAADVMIGAEYGFTDNFTMGIYRSKGAGQTPTGENGLNQLINHLLKYRLVQQSNRLPFSATAIVTTSLSTSTRIEESEAILQSFPEFAHRLVYTGQVAIGRKFSPGFSLEIVPGITHRNLVLPGDQNNLFSLGAATRIQLSRTFGLVADITAPIGSDRPNESDYRPAVGVGVEIETGGHVFQVNFTNATGIIENDYIPYTTSQWSEGEFRLGFTISRWFNL